MPGCVGDGGATKTTKTLNVISKPLRHLERSERSFEVFSLSLIMDMKLKFDYRDQKISLRLLTDRNDHKKSQRKSLANWHIV